MKKKRYADFKETTRKLRVLLISLVLLLVLYPFFTGGFVKTVILDLLFSFIILLSIYAVSYDKKHFIVGLAIGVPTLFVTYSNLFLGAGLLAINQALHALFFLYIMYAVLTFVVKSQKVTEGLIYGAVCAYVLIAFAWTSLYSLVELLVPGSFLIGAATHLSWFDFLYYSFNTLTTLGYGDITPVTYHAQSLALIEATVGVLYIAVFVARLVAAYANNYHKKSS